MLGLANMFFRFFIERFVELLLLRTDTYSVGFFSNAEAEGGSELNLGVTEVFWKEPRLGY